MEHFDVTENKLLFSHPGTHLHIVLLFILQEYFVTSVASVQKPDVLSHYY